MSTDIQVQNQNKALSFINADKLKIYSDVDEKVTELITSNLKGIALTFAKVTVVKLIEDVLTPEFMTQVMNLKGKEYGFKTDEKVGENIPQDKVKACIVQAMLFGAEITGNEFNILGGNCYLTKNFCKNWLRKNKIWYKIIPYFSKKLDSGQWVVPFDLEWKDFSGKLFKEHLDVPVNKFEKTSEATMRGQGERDAMAYIIEELRKESLPMDKREDFVEGTYTEIKEKTQEESKENIQSSTQENPNPVDQQKPILVLASPEIQAEFDKFIDNKNKVKDVQTLTARAKNFLADKQMVISQFNLSKYNEIKFAIDNNTWIN